MSSESVREPFPHTDVIIVGAGISGIDTAYHLRTLSPDRSFVMLEGRSRLGGTWDLFRYPGVRSDSDMYTLGFGFRPWKHAKSIADGASILEYLRATVRDCNLESAIEYDHRVRNASFDSASGRWTVTGDHAGTPFVRTCSVLAICAGYYRYSKGHVPTFPDQDRFRGPIIHPQLWPDDLEYRGQRVAVIGSGATAMTLLPAMASDVAHITMIQRSPTWVVARPSVDPVARWLRRLLPSHWAYRATRVKNVTLGSLFYTKTRRDPDGARRLLDRGIRAGIGDELAAQHFSPSYDPWDQRLCLIPDGDLYDAINSGQASVVTDTIERFTENGITLSSGQHVDADLIITATGLELVTLGEISFSVDGRLIDFAQCWTYKGLAYSDVPNLISTFGFINASWTLRADMVASYTARLLNHMRDTANDIATPRLRQSDASMTARPFVDGFESGYILRSLAMMPRQGDRSPWINPQQVHRTRRLLTESIDDGVMQFTRSSTEPDATIGQSWEPRAEVRRGSISPDSPVEELASHSATRPAAT